MSRRSNWHRRVTLVDLSHQSVVELVRQPATGIALDLDESSPSFEGGSCYAVAVRAVEDLNHRREPSRYTSTALTVELLEVSHREEDGSTQSKVAAAVELSKVDEMSESSISELAASSALKDL